MACSNHTFLSPEIPYHYTCKSTILNNESCGIVEVKQLINLKNLDRK